MQVDVFERGVVLRRVIYLFIFLLLLTACQGHKVVDNSFGPMGYYTVNIDKSLNYVGKTQYKRDVFS